ncbi:MAG TPA: hypothetical protein QF720_06850 [Nitrospinota bacterium]|nr:hypothetical protein [Nitrospinota bacterium]
MRIYLMLAILVAVTWYAVSRIKSTFFSSSPCVNSLEMEKDPVCGKFVARDTAVVKKAPDGFRYYCSHSCASQDALAE